MGEQSSLNDLTREKKEKFDCQIDYNHKNKGISNIAGEYIIVIALSFYIVLISCNVPKDYWRKNIYLFIICNQSNFLDTQTIWMSVHCMEKYW